MTSLNGNTFKSTFSYLMYSYQAIRFSDYYFFFILTPLLCISYDSSQAAILCNSKPSYSLFVYPASLSNYPYSCSSYNSILYNLEVGSNCLSNHLSHKWDLQQWKFYIGHKISYKNIVCKNSPGCFGMENYKKGCFVETSSKLPSSNSAHYLYCVLTVLGYNIIATLYILMTIIS